MSEAIYFHIKKKKCFLRVKAASVRLGRPRSKSTMCVRTRFSLFSAGGSEASAETEVTPAFAGDVSTLTGCQAGARRLTADFQEIRQTYVVTCTSQGGSVP